MIILSSSDNILVYVHWRQLGFFGQRKTDDCTFVIYVAIFRFPENFIVNTVNSVYYIVNEREKRKGMNTVNENTISRLF